MEAPTDNVQPGEKWAFDAAVTDCFEDMLRRSIPQYDVMRQSVFDVGCRFVQPKTAIVDLGCSRGDALAPFVDKFGAHNVFYGVEISQPMLDAARAKFQGMIKCGVVHIEAMDLRREFPPARASLVLCVLTLQFTPIEYRHHILTRIYDSLTPGGALVLVEKVLGNSAPIDELMLDVYYGLKAGNGYTQEAIARKRASLEGVLVPVTAAWNEDLLRGTGFRQVDCFWRWMNFAGWVAVK